LDPWHSIAVLRKWAWLLIGSTLVTGTVAFFVIGSLPKTFDGSVTLNVGQSLTALNPDYNQLLTSQQLAQTYARVATSRPILDKVIEAMDLGVSPVDLGKRVRAEAARDSTFIIITGQDRDPARAAAIANEVAKQLIAASPGIQGRQTDVQSFIDAEVKATERQITDTVAELERLTALPIRTPAQDDQVQTLQNRLASLRSAYSTLFAFSSNSASNLLSVIEPAIPPEAPSSPKVLLFTILAAFAAFAVATAFAFAVDFLDDTVKSPDDVEGLTHLPMLGAIIRMPGDDKRGAIHRLVTHLYPQSPAAEAYRSMRTNIEFTSVDEPIRRLLITSAVPGEGKTTTAANLAVAFAQSGRRTILVDADLRRPGVHELFDLRNDRGLTNLLIGDAVALQTVAQQVEEPNLRVITTGTIPPNPAELLGSNKMVTIMEKLRESCDLVIIDSPPLQAVTDAAILAAMVDGTVLVVRAGATRRAAVRHGLESLGRVGAKVLGVALNRVAGGTLRTYGYASADAAPDGADEAKIKARTRPDGFVAEAETRR
jgi:capsular exopolysaccharide synthesis family protein